MTVNTTRAVLRALRGRKAESNEDRGYNPLHCQRSNGGSYRLSTLAGKP